MNINDLRIGNMVGLAYNPGVITTIIALEFGGAVQVACNNYTDDIRDITGVQLDEQTLERFAIPVRVIKDDIAIDINVKKDQVYMSGSLFKSPIWVDYLHDLQNLIYRFTQIEIIDHKKFRV